MDTCVLALYLQLTHFMLPDSVKKSKTSSKGISGKYECSKKYKPLHNMCHVIQGHFLVFVNTSLQSFKHLDRGRGNIENEKHAHEYRNNTNYFTVGFENNFCHASGIRYVESQTAYFLSRRRHWK